MLKSKLHVEGTLQEIQAAISGWDGEDDLGRVIGEDLKLALESFRAKNILSVINCLAVAAAELQTRLILAQRRLPGVEPVLISIHRLQQILIKLPVRLGEPGAAAAAADPEEIPQSVKTVETGTPVTTQPAETSLQSAGRIYSQSEFRSQVLTRKGVIEPVRKRDGL